MSFLCSPLFLLTANGGHLGSQIAKIKKWLQTRNILAQSSINFNQWFLKYCHFHVYTLILVTVPGSHLDRSIFIKFCNNSMQESFWHKFGRYPQSWINFNQWFFRYRHFRVYANFSNGPSRPFLRVNLRKFEIVPFKKSKRLSTGYILAQSWISFNQWFLRYCHFRVHAIFSNGPWRPSWIVNLHKYEMILFRDHCDQIWPFMFSWDIGIWAKLNL